MGTGEHERVPAKFMGVRDDDRVVVALGAPRGFEGMRVEVPALDVRPLLPVGDSADVALDAAAAALRPWEDSDLPLSTTIRDEAVPPGKSTSAAHRRWGVFYKQFELRRQGSGALYLTRWYLVSTPFFGIALHRMDGPDARDTVHDHPWPFVSVVLRGGYVEDRLDPKTMQPTWAVEMKWSNRYFDKPRELKSLLKFCMEHALKEAIVTTLDVEGVKEVDGVRLHFVPSAVYAYNVGKRTLQAKQGRQ